MPAIYPFKAEGDMSAILRLGGPEVRMDFPTTIYLAGAEIEITPYFMAEDGSRTEFSPLGLTQLTLTLMGMQQQQMMKRTQSNIEPLTTSYAQFGTALNEETTNRKATQAAALAFEKKIYIPRKRPNLERLDPRRRERLFEAIPYLAAGLSYQETAWEVQKSLTMVTRTFIEARWALALKSLSAVMLVACANDFPLKTA